MIDNLLICPVIEHMRYPALLWITLLFSFVLPRSGVAQAPDYEDSCLTNVDNATVLLPTSADLMLPGSGSVEPADTVAVRNPKGDCVGYGVWEEDSGGLTIAAAGPSSTDQLKSGYEQGDSLSFEVFDASQEEVVEIGRSVEYASCDSIAIATCSDQGTYVDGALLVISSLSPIDRLTRTISGTDGSDNDKGWRLLASPAPANRSDLEDDLNFDASSRTLTYDWNGSQWASLSSSDSLRRGRGFILFLDDDVNPVSSDGLTLDVPASGHKRSTSVSSALNTNERFHLLGNPYDVAFDLSELRGPNGTPLGEAGLQAAVMVWDPDEKRWTAITEDPSSTDDMIAAWQGFFVRRLERGEGASALTFRSSGTLQDPGDLIGGNAKANDQLAEAPRATVDLELTVTDASDTLATDEATVLFDKQATEGWDPYEASQLPPLHSNPYVTLSSPVEHNGKIVRRLQASRSYPTEPSEITIPLSVQSVDLSGTATLHWPASEREALPADWGVELVDTATGERIDVRRERYTFQLDAGEGELSSPAEARFQLHITPYSGTVELAQFEAQASERSSVQLTWQTSRETKTKGFYVQRKTVGQKAKQKTDWHRLGFVKSAGEDHTYRFTDEDVPFAADSVRYRLRQVSTTGGERVTDERMVTRATPGQVSLKAPFPNPVRHRATLHFEVPEATEGEMALYDLLGRRVSTLTKGRLEKGRHEHQLSTSELSAGTYFLRLRAGGHTETRKLTVVR